MPRDFGVRCGLRTWPNRSPVPTFGVDGREAQKNKISKNLETRFAHVRQYPESGFLPPGTLSCEAQTLLERRYENNSESTPLQFSYVRVSRPCWLLGRSRPSLGLQCSPRASHRDRRLSSVLFVLLLAIVSPSLNRSSHSIHLVPRVSHLN